jgi:hypothetical protein
VRNDEIKSVAKKDACSAAQVRALLGRLAVGESLRLAVKAEGVSLNTALRRLWSDRWVVQYARAREMGADVLASKVVDTADLVGLGKLKAEDARVMIDAYKWAAGKQLPKRYADASGQRVAVQAESASSGAGSFSFRIDLSDGPPIEGRA